MAPAIRGRAVNALLARVRAALLLAPGTRTGRDRGLAVAALVMVVLLFGMYVVPQPTLEGVLGISTVFGLTLLAVAAVLAMLAVLRAFTFGFWAAVLALLLPVSLGLVMSGFALRGVLPIALGIAAGAALLGGGLAAFRSRTSPRLGAAFAVLGVVCLAGIGVALLVPGWQSLPDRPALPPAHAPAGLADPTRPGRFGVREFTYGSGKDRHRPEYGARASVRSRSVDGSALVDGWEGAAGWARTRYWGFDAHALPLQGRVWMPEGAGPFPLVLVVHGNHELQDFSDAGYAYLGRHFASHGYATISIDENFLNSGDLDMVGGFDAGLESENDARAWLLLEHLRQIRDWSRTPGNPFHRRVDLGRVVLAGHSRGGEAVAEAALFDRLAHYPDDATLRFDYRFGIRGVIAIAPADGQYDPRNRGTALADMSYLTIHGSHDGDVQSFVGTAQYARTRFPTCRTCFKASVYVLGANHGQFNTDWGRWDHGLPSSLVLDVAPIVPERTQREVALAYFTSFLHATLGGKPAYEAVFAAPSSRVPWLRAPVEVVIDHASGDEIVVADYEEDADVTTASWAGATLSAQGITVWREIDPELKWQARDSALVTVGWDRSASDARGHAFDARGRAFDARGRARTRV